MFLTRNADWCYWLGEVAVNKFDRMIGRIPALVEGWQIFL